MFEVEAQTGKAEQSLKSIQQRMDEIEKIRNRGSDNYDTTSQKEMYKAMRNMSELTQQYKEANRELESIKSNMSNMFDSIQVPKNASREQLNQMNSLRTASYKNARAAVQQQRELQQAYAKSLSQLRELSSFQQTPSKAFRSPLGSNDIRNVSQDPVRARGQTEALANRESGADSVTDRLKEQMKEVRELDKRTSNRARQATASKYMSYQQSSDFGADVMRSRNDFTDDREKNLQSMTRNNMERSRLSREVSQVQSNPDNYSQEERDRAFQMQETIREIDREQDIREKLNRTLNQTMENVEQANSDILGAGVEARPKRGTISSMAVERAPSIGMGISGAVGLTLGGMYARGDSAESNMRDDIIAIGQRTEQDRWRQNVRDDAINSGLENRLGFTGQEMLTFQQNYLGNRGYQSMEDLDTAMTSQAEFSRVTGSSAETTSQFWSGMFDSAALVGNDVKDIQNAFVGGIKESGMQGREEAQLKATESLVSTISQGRTVGREGVLNLMGLQSVLNQSGVKPLRGETGSQFLQDINTGIRQGIDDPSTRLMFGQGSIYQGLGGSWELAQQMEKGIQDPRNIRTIGSIAESFSSTEEGQNYASLQFLRGNLGVDASTEQVEGLMDLYRSGQLSDENIQDVMQSTQQTGEEASQESAERYSESNEATRNQSEAVSEKQAININDFGDLVRSANSAMSQVPTLAYAVIAAFGSLAVSIAGIASMLGTSGGVGKVGQWLSRTGGKYNDPDGGKGPFVDKNGNPISSQKQQTGGGGFFSFGGFGGGDDSTTRDGKGPAGRVGGLFNKAKQGPSKAKNWAKNIFSGGGGNSSGILPQAPGGGNFLGGLGKVAGKAFLPLSLLSTAGSVINSSSASSTGNALGSLGGGLGGGGIGAAIGTMIMPGIGTAIGGGIGSIVGSFGGSKIGEAIGGLFGGGDSESSTQEETTSQTNTDQESSSQSQLDRENTTQAANTERLRTDNIANMRSNLNQQQGLVNQIRDLLQQSAIQNGVVGNVGNSMGTTNAGNPAQQVAGSGNAEKIWNFFANNGFNPQATAGIMGNLQQESGLDPTAVNPTSGASGVGQWLDGRLDNLHSFASDRGTSPKNLQTQLEFMLHEMQGGDAGTDFSPYGGLDAFKNADDVNKATNVFEDVFERSGGSAMGNRRDYANEFLNRYQSSANTGNTATQVSTASANPEITSTINVQVSADEKVSDKVNDSKDMEQTARNIHDRVYGSMNFHSIDTVRI